MEKIHTWWVAFVDKNGIVRRVASRPSSFTSYVDEERVEMNLPTGTYTIYAFANWETAGSTEWNAIIAKTTDVNVLNAFIFECFYDFIMLQM